ncbi:hypothetical protein [Limnobacter sp.]|uniref:hypothetical protein n=1 Tax=Limnobacter sp. TaxID=2003368 RepID=UPI00351276DE
MAAGWVTVLQMVPWTEVIKNAPKVAEGAVKLWNTVSKKTPVTDAEATDELVVLDEQSEMEALTERLVRSEQALADVQEELVQSTQVIKDLAAQNAQLVKQVEANRKALTVLGVVVVLLAVGLVTQAVALFAA